MKANKKSGSIAALLTRYYLAFTAALLLVFAGVYALWNRLDTRIFEWADAGALVGSAAFRSGEYRNVDTERYLGGGGAFAVFDAEGNPLYKAAGFLPSIRTVDELLCVPKYNEESAFALARFTTYEGRTRTLLSRYTGIGDSLKAETILLDEDNHVLAGGVRPGKLRYSEAELGFLTGSWSDRYALSRYESMDTSGEPVTVVLQTRVPTEGDYRKASAEANRVWLLLIPLYAVTALAFIVLLDRHIRRPLQKLGEAIERFGEGDAVSAGCCGGPREIQSLGDSFDEMADKLAQSVRERTELERQRQKMIADISHDLRTPITVIAGYTDAMRDGKAKPEEIPRYLDAIANKTAVLSELAESFYEYSKTEHPDFHLKTGKTDVCEFLRVYLASKYDEIDLAGFSLDVDIPETRIDCMIDGFQLRRALDNLLNDSLRHNARGTTVFAALEKRDGGALIRFGDDGCGIPEALRADIFSPFVVGSESRSSGGSGLGLAISKKIVEAHGGELRLADEPMWRKGTEFDIFLVS